jgi:hypothetical protein
VTSRRDRDWLARFIVSPEMVREAGDPIALALRAKYQQVVMPSLDLGKTDAALLIDYIDRPSTEIMRSQEVKGSVDQKEVSSPVDRPRTPAGGANLKTMLDAYVRIQRALNVDLAGNTVTDARTIASEAAKLGAGGDLIQASANELEKATTLAATRSAFGAVSDAILAYARESGVAFEGRHQGGVLPDGEQALAAERRRRAEPVLREVDVRLRPHRRRSRHGRVEVMLMDSGAFAARR